MPKCVKNPCSICKFRVHDNHKAIFCNICHLWTHMKCTPLSLSEYNDLTHCHDDWYCPSCLSDTFPFNHFDNDTDFYFALLDLQSSANFDGSFWELNILIRSWKTLILINFFTTLTLIQTSICSHQLLTYYLDVLIRTVDSSIICSLTPLTPTASHYFT